LAKRERKEIRKAMGAAQVAWTVSTLQALARGRLYRQKAAAELSKLRSQEAMYTRLQSHLRGVLVRRKQRAREEKLGHAADYIVAIQAACRGLLARQKKWHYVQHLQQSIPVVSSLQAAARARLARQQHQSMQKALAKVEVAGSVGGLQAFLRSRLAKKQTTEQKKKLEFVQPDVIGFQAVARGYLARQDYEDWRDHLKDPHTQGALVFLQSLVRGFLARRRFWIRISHYHHRVPDIVKIQAIWRGRTERQMYERLLTGVNVDVPTIQNYMHLLDDTDADYQRQIRTETLRREVVRLIRENQTLETEVKDLDTKIALILKNKMSFEDMVRAKHRMSRDVPEEHAWKDSTGRDPFTSAHLDRTSQRKLELFEYLFFMLQTKGEYLSRLLYRLSRDDEHETERRQLESVVLILFGYGQEKREDYLFHKLLQVSLSRQGGVWKLTADLGARGDPPLDLD
jgi:Ras GTPase-activating-like protein IQGAP2/3